MRYGADSIAVMCLVLATGSCQARAELADHSWVAPRCQFVAKPTLAKPSKEQALKSLRRRVNRSDSVDALALRDPSYKEGYLDMPAYYLSPQALSRFLER